MIHIPTHLGGDDNVGLRRSVGIVSSVVSSTSILDAFDATKVSQAARLETRRREASLPVIGLYRWWARRTVSVSSALLDAAAVTADKHPLVVLDPFAGGGVIAATALARGHTVVAQEIDPWAAQNLAVMTTRGDPDELSAVFEHLATVIAEMPDPYLTTEETGEPARMSQTFRVMTGTCPDCAAELKLFQRALVTRNRRVDAKRAHPGAGAWFACEHGHLHSSSSDQYKCPECKVLVRATDSYITKRIVTCRHCGRQNPLAKVLGGKPTWLPILVQRMLPDGRASFGQPSDAELSQINSGDAAVDRVLAPVGNCGEPAVLSRHGFSDFAELYPARQFDVLSRLRDAAKMVPGVSDWARAIAWSCVIGSAEFAGHATRWDPNYLKPYETIANHRFSLTTVATEIDPWGVHGRGTVPRRLMAAGRAAAWLSTTEARGQTSIRRSGSRGLKLQTGITVITGSSERIPVPDASIDLILTDPPYHDDVQYPELSNLFRAWADLVLGRIAGDATASPRGGEGELERFGQALSAVFRECRRVLAPDGHLVLSFANRDPKAWVALVESLDSSGWHCCGFDVVHAENERDAAKAGKRACNLDVILDLVLASPASRHVPTRLPGSVEERFCFVAGHAALKVGDLVEGWDSALVKTLRDHEFLRPIKPPPDRRLTG